MRPFGVFGLKFKDLLIIPVGERYFSLRFKAFLTISSCVKHKDIRRPEERDGLLSMIEYLIYSIPQHFIIKYSTRVVNGISLSLSSVWVVWKWRLDKQVGNEDTDMWPRHSITL